MKKNFLKLGLFALAFGFMFNATAQCPNDNFPYLNWNLSQEGQSVSTGCLFGGEYNSLNVIEGASYEISTCESSWDTQVTIYNASTGAVVGYNDDACGLQSIVNFTASFTGTVNILLDRYNCQDEFSCGSMTATLISLGGGPAPCDSPLAIECGTPLPFNLASGAGSYNPVDGPWGTPGNEAVYSFTPETNGSYAISVIHPSSGWVDLFYQAATCEAEGWLYVDDILSSGTNSVNLTGGVTYFFLIDDENTSASSGSIEIICPTVATDPCDDIVDMTCGLTYNWASGAGSGSFNPPSGPWGTPGQENVFSYTPPSDGSYLISMTNSGYYTDIFVALSCGANADWQYIDDVFSATNITATLTGGVTYYFLLDDEDLSPSTGTLSVSCPCIPPAGGVDESITVTSNTSYSSTTDGACNDCDLRTSQDRILEVNIPCPGTYTFTTCGGASWDTYLYLTTAPCGGSLVALNDDACGLQSSITASLQPGTYYLAVEAFSSFSSGDFTVDISKACDLSANLVPSVQACGFNVSCNGGDDGSLTVASNGCGVLTYDWSNGASGAVNSGLTAGSYSMTMTDSFGCSASASATLTEPEPVMVNAGQDQTAYFGYDPLSCVELNSSEAMGGCAPYTYQWGANDGNIVTPNSGQPWIAYMNVFNTDGGYIFGSPWALPDVKTTVDGGSNTITLQPNFNTYNGADSFWSDGNGNGNKLMEANTYIESGAWNGSDLTFTGTVESNTLADGYTATYFIKALNPAAGFSDALGGSATFAIPASGDFSVSVDASQLSPGLIVQTGFAIVGINANPANEDNLGSIVISGGAATNSLTACPEESTDYTMTVTDANGCIGRDDVTVCVIDVRCYAGNSGNQKVEMCHVPHGNPGNEHTICIDESAVPAHLAHGCRLGSCEEANDCGSQSTGMIVTSNGEHSMHSMKLSSLELYPNPANEELNVHVDSESESNVYTIVNALGQIVNAGVIENGRITIDVTTFESGIYYFNVEGITPEIFIKK